MFTKNQIDNWIELFATSDNREDFEKYADTSSEPRSFLKRDLVEAKMMVDRWGTIVTDWVFHTSKKPIITAVFPEDDGLYKDTDAVSLRAALQTLVKYASILELGIDLKGRTINDLTDEECQKIEQLSSSNKTYHIWGANVHFTDDISPNAGIGVSLNKDNLTLHSNESNNLTNSIIVFNVW
jgi:hypothetical protein